MLVVRLLRSISIGDSDQNLRRTKHKKKKMQVFSLVFFLNDIELICSKVSVIRTICKNWLLLQSFWDTHFWLFQKLLISIVSKFASSRTIPTFYFIKIPHKYYKYYSKTKFFCYNPLKVLHIPYTHTYKQFMRFQTKYPQAIDSANTRQGYA